MAITNRQSRQCVERLEPFKTGNQTLYAVWKDRLYVVFSYGSHWPLFIYDSETSTWFENSSRHSVTTSKHRSQARPFNTELLDRDVDWMRKCVESKGVGITEELLVKSLPLC